LQICKDVGKGWNKEGTDKVEIVQELSKRVIDLRLGIMKEKAEELQPRMKVVDRNLPPSL